jgi:hypothetical protein
MWTQHYHQDHWNFHSLHFICYAFDADQDILFCLGKSSNAIEGRKSVLYDDIVAPVLVDYALADWQS